MTAPVETHMADSDMVMAFMMPSEYSMESLPEPTDPRVVLKKMPGRSLAAVRFSGSWSEERFQEHTEMLREWLGKRRYRGSGMPTVARYDPPWTPWFMGRNEILVEVAYPAEEKGEATGRNQPDYNVTLSSLPGIRAGNSRGHVSGQRRGGR